MILLTIACVGFFQAEPAPIVGSCPNEPVPVKGNLEHVWPLEEDNPGPNIESSVSITYGEGPNRQEKTAAIFDGRTSRIVLPNIELGSGDFTVSLWVNADGEEGGDLLSQFDPKTRTGWHLGLYTHGGVTNSQPNLRQLHFGIDQGRLDPLFQDHGKLGTAIYPFSLCVYKGKLYASTCHPGTEEAGHVYRWEGGERWTDLGSPDRANSVSAMAVFNEGLFVATSKYRLAGSALTESENPNFGGKIYQLGAKDEWIPRGTLSPETEGVGAMVVYQGRLYASSLYRPAGFFRYEGEEKWTSLPTPEGKRVEAMIVHNGHLYATSYDGAYIFRFDGERWETIGQLPESTQTYGFAIHQGDLYVSEWPQARVFRYQGGTEWTNVGKLGNELESMPLLVYNGMMYGGTLPSAEVFRFDGEQQWTSIGRVDLTPDVKYRRAWSMAVFQGRMFVGALPSGRVLSIEAGRNATWDQEFPKGWHHLAAVRESNLLALYVDGKLVSQSAQFEASEYNLDSKMPLVIGRGAQDSFQGRIAKVRLVRKALKPPFPE